MGYRWAVYFAWNDGVEDSFNCETAKERDKNIRWMIESGNFSMIKYCRIYANGEYGVDKVVFDNAHDA